MVAESLCHPFREIQFWMDAMDKAEDAVMPAVSKGVILQNPHTLHVSKAEAQRAD